MVAHLCCSVDTMGGRAGLLQMILSISSHVAMEMDFTSWKYVEMI